MRRGDAGCARARGAALRECGHLAVAGVRRGVPGRIRRLGAGRKRERAERCVGGASVPDQGGGAAMDLCLCHHGGAVCRLAGRGRVRCCGGGREQGGVGSGWGGDDEWVGRDGAVVEGQGCGGGVTGREAALVGVE